MITIEERRRSLGRIAAVLTLTVLVIVALSVSAGDTASASLAGQAGTTAAQVSKIEDKVLQDTANGKSASFIVLLSERADLSAAHAMRDHDARGWYVYNTLKAHAEKSQAGIRSTLSALGASYKSLWAANALVVTGDRTLVEALAARPDVRRIESDRPSQGINPIVESKSAAYAAPDAIEWGVSRVRAPDVWAMGYKGQGIVIGNQDTGVRWTHNAVKRQYRGWNGAAADHNYNWWDGVRVPTVNPCGWSSPEPCDDDELLGGGHGTHTTGTVLGDDGMGNQIGVAPEAEWIACRNMDRGVGRPSTYMECFQFFLAPTDLNGQNPDPARRPHVMNNSWACLEGCAPDTLRQAVENSHAAGIFVEASAGNDGPACSTVAWAPALYEVSFSTGATDINNVLASFSSRGPVLVDGSGRLKPNISAPGRNVRSALRASDTAYGNLSGTSMAGPHVVGVVALLWSARPDLVRQIDVTKHLLQDTANPNVTVSPAQTCGDTSSTQIPNNSFGYGRVDAYAALGRAQATVTPVPRGCDTRQEYVVSESSGGAIDPGLLPVVGSQCDDCVVSIDLPFAYYFYGQPYTRVNASSNGNLQFMSSNPAHQPTCLPNSQFNNAIFAFWRDLDLRTTAWPTNGIYTSVTGEAPNRVFNIEWRGCIFASGYCGGGQANFQVRLFEGQNRFEIIYGEVDFDLWPATVGAQQGTGTTYTQYACAARPFEQGLKLTFNYECLPPTHTPTPIPTNTPTPTSTLTPQPTNTNTPEPTNTPVPTSTPVACNICGLEVQQASVACNLGAVRWTASVRNKNQCTAVNGWQADLLVRRTGSGTFERAASQRGTGSFPPGTSQLAGNICYSFPADAAAIRVEVSLDSDNERCRPYKKSEVGSPCWGACP